MIEQATARSAESETTARFEREAALRERLFALGRLQTLIAQEIRQIRRELARSGRLAGNVLDFTRPIRLELTPVDVAALVWDAASSILDGWEAPHVRIALEPGVGTIVTDAARLYDVLANVLANAKEALRAAGRIGAVDGIEIGGRRVDSGLRLWVVDRGAGSASLDLVARKIVAALQGRIWIESGDGAGTRVEIELPAGVAASGGRPARESSEWEGHARKAGGRA